MSRVWKNFSQLAAQYAIDHVAANWKENALKKSKNISRNDGNVSKCNLWAINITVWRKIHRRRSTVCYR